MRKFYLFFFLVFFTTSVIAQEPFIATSGGDGLGQYGYLEKDAVTFSRLERNTYNNIDFLSARWWVTDNNSSNGNGKEYLYHVYNGPDWINGIGWQCGGDNYPSKRTTDYDAANFSPEWGAGTDCYVSVCAKYCGNSYYPAGFDGFSTNGAVGFNERHFRVLDVDTNIHASTASLIGDAAGVCQTINANNVAGSFAINPGAFTGIVLTTLILKNNGTALEGTDIPNMAFSIYYEPVTGSEIYGDGNEIFAGTIAGNWDGNITDNIFASTTLNIPLNGSVRIYVLLCSFNSPVAEGKHINLSIVNDGIFLSPAINGFDKLRINAGSISQQNIILPVKFISFNGVRNNESVLLNWKAVFTSQPDYFKIQQSNNGIYFTDAGKKMVADIDLQQGQYRFELNSTATFFRIAAVFNNQEKLYSAIINLKNNYKNGLRLLQNPVTNSIVLESNLPTVILTELKLFDETGRIFLQKNQQINYGINKIDLPVSNSFPKFIFLQLTDKSNQQYLFRIAIN